MTTPERETPAKPKEVGEIPETPEIPEHIEKGGVSPIPTQITTQVQDDQGDDLLQTPDTRGVVELPKTQAQLETLAKGDAEDASTWLGVFWIYMIRKALHFGRKIIGRGSEVDK